MKAMISYHKNVQYTFSMIRLQRNKIVWFLLVMSFNGRISNLEFTNVSRAHNIAIARRIGCNFDEQLIDSVLYSPHNHAYDHYKFFGKTGRSVFNGIIFVYMDLVQ